MDYAIFIKSQLIQLIQLIELIQLIPNGAHAYN